MVRVSADRDFACLSLTGGKLKLPSRNLRPVINAGSVRNVGRAADTFFQIP